MSDYISKQAIVNWIEKKMKDQNWSHEVRYGIKKVGNEIGSGRFDRTEAELTKERESNQRLAGIEQALQDFTRFESTKASEVYDWLESVTGYRSGGNEPNEG